MNWSLVIGLGALSGLWAGIRQPTSLRRAGWTGFVYGCITASTATTYIFARAAVRNHFHPMILTFGLLFILLSAPAGGVVGFVTGAIRRSFRDRSLPLRFSLKSVFIAVIALSAGLAVLVKDRGVFEIVEYYEDGEIMHRYSMYRDVWGTVTRRGKQISYYPNGARCYEFDCPQREPEIGGIGYDYNGRVPRSLRFDGGGRWYLPDGPEVSQKLYLDYALAGKSSFHDECLATAPDSLVWCQNERIWRKRKPSDAPGRIQP